MAAPACSVSNPTRISPSSKVFSPLMQRSSVDLPAPLGPMRATVSPAAIVRLTSSSTSRWPNRLRSVDDDVQEDALIGLCPSVVSRYRDK